MNKYHWHIDSEMNRLISELESVKLLIASLPRTQSREANLRQNSILKSAVFSARIEGFTDTIHAPKKESQNLLRTYHYLFSGKAPHKISLSFIKKIHKFVLHGLASGSGSWRTQPWVIFNQSGAVIYLAPPHPEIPLLMEEFVKFINHLSDHPGVKSAVAQFIFEKIHPFADGNGRVGRLISAHILNTNGFGFNGLTPFEEYLDNNREDYYYHLESGSNCSGFIKYFLRALVYQSKEHVKDLSSLEKELPEDSLLPRRRELLRIISEHPNCSFDFLQRRFLAVNGKTLHYDLLKLIEAGFIHKLGATKGVVYASSK